MDPVTLDLLLCEALLTDLTAGLDSIYDRLADLFESWRRSGADESAIVLLGQILYELGWWSGRAEAASSAGRASLTASDGP